MSDLSDETRDLIARGRGGVPLSPARRNAIRAGMAAKLTAAAVLGTTTTAKAAAVGAGWSAVAFKVVGVAAVLAVVGAGTMVVVKDGARREAVASGAGAGTRAPSPGRASSTVGTTAPGTAGAETDTAPTAAAETAAAETAPTAAAVLAGGGGTTVPSESPTAVAAADNAAPVANTVATPNAMATVAAGKVGASAAVPLAVPPTRAESQTRAGTGTTTGSGTTAGSGTTNTAGPASAGRARATPSSLEAEALLLQEAHRALSAGDGTRALRLLDEHASRFPISTLEPERSAERVFALCQQQRVDAARTTATTFLASHPDGHLAARVRSSCVKLTP